MKVGSLSPLLGWLIGTVVASAIFFVGGVPILFAAAFYAGHQPSDDVPSKVIAFAVLLAVVSGCIWIAWAARRFLARD